VACAALRWRSGTCELIDPLTRGNLVRERGILDQLHCILVKVNVPAELRAQVLLDIHLGGSSRGLIQTLTAESINGPVGREPLESVT
jgi:hypothetical protein